MQKDSSKANGRSVGQECGTGGTTDSNQSIPRDYWFDNWFKQATASIIGREHRTTDRNNQDGRVVYDNPCRGWVIGVVTDGCGDEKAGNSELGAQLGAELIAKSINDNLQSGKENPLENAEEFMEFVRIDALAKLNMNIHNMLGHRSEIVRKYFLFTAIGFIITPEKTIVFCLGDGVAAMNNSVQIIDSGVSNEPTYMAYALVETTKPKNSLRFKILWEVPTDEVQTLMVGTDGLNYLLQSADKTVPGKEELVGQISQFWENEFFFKNPDGLRRRLSLIGRDVRTMDGTETGHLKDDTTMIVARRF